MFSIISPVQLSWERNTDKNVKFRNDLERDEHIALGFLFGWIPGNKAAEHLFERCRIRPVWRMADTTQDH
jgi:hypothetical protein